MSSPDSSTFFPKPGEVIDTIQRFRPSVKYQAWWENQKKDIKAWQESPEGLETERQWKELVAKIARKAE